MRLPVLGSGKDVDESLFHVLYEVQDGKCHITDTHIDESNPGVLVLDDMREPPDLMNTYIVSAEYWVGVTRTRLEYSYFNRTTDRDE